MWEMLIAFLRSPVAREYARRLLNWLADFFEAEFA